MGITHTKVSAIADDSAASARGEVLPSDWNADHTITPPLTLTAGTVTADTPVIDATQTWNAAGVTFTGWKRRTIHRMRMISTEAMTNPRRGEMTMKAAISLSFVVCRAWMPACAMTAPERPPIRVWLVLEGMRLRVKDVDFARREIVVREGKGNKDRVTMLPATLVEPLRARVKLRQHQHVIDLGFCRT